MMKLRLITLFSTSVLIFASCKPGKSGSGLGPEEDCDRTPVSHPQTFGSTKNPPTEMPTTRFSVYNGCDDPVYLQGSEGSRINNVKLESKRYFAVTATETAIAGFRIYPKIGCDATGSNCDIGGDGQPDINSATEITIDSDTNQTMHINASAVDGFTIPYAVKIYRDDTESSTTCSDSNALNLKAENCPTDDNLSTPKNYFSGDLRNYAFGSYPDDSLIHANLQVTNQSKKKVVGCYSPKSKLSSQTDWGGYAIGTEPGLAQQQAFVEKVIMYTNPYDDYILSGSNGETCSYDPHSDVHQKLVLPNDTGLRNLQRYCADHPEKCGPCSSSPKNFSSQLGHMGPIVCTDYVKYLHKNSDVYAWQYDDGLGLRQCNSKNTKALFVLCAEPQ